ncbi:hypothetical protein [Thalassomonas sp. M1454]|uniref:hypothetical protein n=1 Tax=Thalassomonas sp. M1454 TaxID=2594477 RepID=UPI00117D04DF|nr:hypothetical protein [Thalassomonas sp. M1454]TRX53472.1 hypothetical protein FNN08_14465 [Thalassomonas sp. M1454]
MKRNYDEVEQVAFAILFTTGAITQEQLLEEFDVEHSTIRSWKSLMMNNVRKIRVAVVKQNKKRQTEEAAIMLSVEVKS